MHQRDLPVLSVWRKLGFLVPAQCSWVTIISTSPCWEITSSQHTCKIQRERYRKLLKLLSISLIYLSVTCITLPGFAMKLIETGDMYWPSRHWTNYLSTTSSLGLIKSLANCCSFSVSSHSTLLSSLFNSWQQSRDIRERVSNNFNTVLCYLSTLQHNTEKQCNGCKSLLSARLLVHGLC